MTGKHLHLFCKVDFLQYDKLCYFLLYGTINICKAVNHMYWLFGCLKFVCVIFST